MLDYYQPIFPRLMAAVERSGYRTDTPHPLRRAFWKEISPGMYIPDVGGALVQRYQQAVEVQLSQQLARHSLAYWLHIHRRLGPTTFGPQMTTRTVAILRATLEAAMQKYARFGWCDGIGLSSEVRMSSILAGKLVDRAYKVIRDQLRETPQLVLTKFARKQLIEFYDLEKLAFEIWRSAAALRILGKGAPLVVTGAPDPDFGDARSDELDRLVMSYDRRATPLATSATGTTFPNDPDTWRGPHAVFMPQLNAEPLVPNPMAALAQMLHKVTVPADSPTNFVWLPINLMGYLDAHQPFAAAFEARHGLPLHWVVGVIGTLCLGAEIAWRHGDFRQLWHHWQRAYEGPVRRSLVIDLIAEHLAEAFQLMGLARKEARSMWRLWLVSWSWTTPDAMPSVWRSVGHTQSFCQAATTACL
jgi:hypothetical protein